jgi:hypothetical protein
MADTSRYSWNMPTDVCAEIVVLLFVREYSVVEIVAVPLNSCAIGILYLK